MSLYLVKRKRYLFPKIHLLEAKYGSLNGIFEKSTDLKSEILDIEKEVFYCESRFFDIFLVITGKRFYPL
jgi:hypothetical protein